MAVGARSAQQASAASERLLPDSNCRLLLAVRAGLRHSQAAARGAVREAEDAVGELAAVADPAPFLDLDIRWVAPFFDLGIRCEWLSHQRCGWLSHLRCEWLSHQRVGGRVIKVAGLYISSCRVWWVAWI